MAYFPLCIDLEGADVILAGTGVMAEEKRKILCSFGAKVRPFSGQEGDLEPRPALVVAADLPQQERERISALCRSRNIPVNVVDDPALSTFYFPSVINRGDLTVAVSTGGKSPTAAAWLRRHLERHIPSQTARILDWAWELRQMLRRDYPAADRRKVLRWAVGQALTEDRLLAPEEVLSLLQESEE